MSSVTAVSVEEYLGSAYSPDREYVDGVLVERHVGDWLHSLIQSNVLFALRKKYPNIKVVPELRSQITPTRFRLPDVCVLLSAPATRYLVDAAFVAIDILSADDRMSEVMGTLAEYEAKGVPNIWLIDPQLKQISVYRDGTLTQVRTGAVSTFEQPVLELTHTEAFEQ